MKKLFNWIVVLGLSGAIFTGCKIASAGKVAMRQTGKAAQAESSGQDSLVEDDQEVGSTPGIGNAEALARFAAGASYEDNGDVPAALTEYEKSAAADPSNEDLAIRLARQYIREKKAEKAVAILSKAAARPNASPLIFSWQGRALLQAGKSSPALQAAEKAIARSPGTLDGYQVVAEVYSERKEFAEVLKTLNRASKHAKNDAGVLIRLGELYNDLAEDDAKLESAARAQALKHFSRAAALKPESPSAQRRMADGFHRAGDSKRAAEIYADLLKRYSDSPVALQALREQLANIYLQSNNKKAAAQQLEAIVRDDPTRYPEAWYYLGAIATGEKNFTEAAGHFEKAIRLNPLLDKAYYELALVQTDLSRTNDAIQTLQRAEEKFRNTFAHEFFAGLVYTRMKDYTTALKHYTAAEVIARATAPKHLDAPFYFQIGAACERIKNYRDAENYFEKCIQLTPDFSEALNYLGYMWAERGENLAKARGLIEKALKNEPKNAAYLDSMGWVLFKLNQPQQALPYMLKAVGFNNEPDPTVFDHLGDIYMALRQRDKACEAWKKSLSIESNEEIQKKLSRAAGAS